MTRFRHPLFARLYPRMSRAMDQGGLGQRRDALLAGLGGEVVEVGAGDGALFARYPTEVDRVLAVEPEPHLRRLAQAAARHASVPVDVVDGRAESLPVADGSCDAAVVSLVLCSFSDPDRSLRELFRVLKPGGQLRFLEHVRADSAGLVRVQRFLDATVWPRLTGGCHTSRDTAAVITRAGFTIDHVDRFLFPEARTPVSFHILGSATRPSTV